jgi:hypothetical protein
MQFSWYTILAKYLLTGTCPLNRFLWENNQLSSFSTVICSEVTDKQMCLESLKMDGVCQCESATSFPVLFFFSSRTGVWTQDFELKFQIGKKKKKRTKLLHRLILIYFTLTSMEKVSNHDKWEGKEDLNIGNHLKSVFN